MNYVKKSCVFLIKAEDCIRDGHVTGVQTCTLPIKDVTETQLLEQELIHSERLASVGRLAAGVAHEIGNPITGIACLAQNLQYGSANAEALEAAEQILSQTHLVRRSSRAPAAFSAHATRTRRL